MTFVSNAMLRARALSRWRRDTNGVVAVEFSLLGIPFMMMVIGIIELSMMFTAQALLQESAFNASRMIRTGQLQKSAAGGQETMFRNKVCDFAGAMIPCSKIKFQVKKLNSFADASTVPVYDKDGNFIPSTFTPGVENDVVLIRVSYNYPIVTPIMWPFLTSRSDHTRPMLSTIVLRTEPYQ